ncbi:MAG: NAD(P)/FAD-dependent oxidoreductase [Rhodoferax sp.]|nr:NAD(P)/FAD-dependent oxidoreductase [Rhodoferax sp.]
MHSSQPSPEPVDAVVIGAGVVGLAVARSLALAGREVWVLESENAIGTGVSARNSEVIHAGLYYAAGSLKARTCVQGRQLLYAYCAERGIAHQRCGKLIVGHTPAQLELLRMTQAKAQANGVSDLQWLSRHEAQALEPALECQAALRSPSTGIVDSHALMLSLQADIENAGGQVVLNALVSDVALAQGADGRHEVRTADGTCLAAHTVVNAAGLSAPTLAHRFTGLAARHIPQAFYAKGSYFTLAGRAPFRHLVYPVPEAAGLGVHLTLDLGGQAKFGPDVEWVDAPDAFAVDPRHAQGFYAAVRHYWPGLPDGALQPAYAGIRPKISGPDAPAADFCVQGPQDHGVAGLVNLFGIESPGLTSALALGDWVEQLLAD